MIKNKILIQDWENDGEFSEKEILAENAIVKWMEDAIYTRQAEKSMLSSDEPYCRIFTAPTGDGKTWAFRRCVRNYIEAIGVDAFIKKPQPLLCFVSSVKSTIPTRWKEEDELADSKADEMFETLVSGPDAVLTAAQYKTVTMVYHSVMDNLDQNMKKVVDELKNCSIPELSEPCRRLANEYQNYISWCKINGTTEHDDSAEKVRRADSALRRTLRTYITSKLNALGIKVDGHSCMRFVRENYDLRWVETLYPEIALPEKRIVFLTVDKAFDSCSPIVYQSSQFFNLPPCANGTLFIDESDQAYSTLRRKCIEDSNESYDLLTRFIDVRNNIIDFSDFSFYERYILDYGKPKDKEQYEAALTRLKKEKAYQKCKDEYQGAPGTMITGVYNDIKAFFDKYGLNSRSFVGDESQTRQEAKYGFFLFNTYFRISVVRHDKKTHPTIEISVDRLTLTYTVEMPDKDKDFLVFIEELKAMLNRFVIFLAHVSALKSSFSGLDYEMCQKQLLVRLFRSHQNDAARSFGKSPYERWLYEASYLGKQDGVLPAIMFSNSPDTCLAATGFKFDYTKHIFADISGELDISPVECKKTPESVLLAAAKKMNILLVSATADLDCYIRNFNLSYLNSLVRDGVFPSEQQNDEIAACHADLQKGSEKVKVEVTRFGLTDAEYRVNTKERWAKLLRPKLDKKPKRLSIFDLSQKQEDILPKFSKTCHVYFCDDETAKGKNDAGIVFQNIRLYNIVSFILSYIEHYREYTCANALYYSNKLFKDAIAGDTSDSSYVTKENLYSIINYYLEENPLKAAVKLTAKDFIFCANSKEIASAKASAQKNMDLGLPAVIITSFNSAAVGQNFQMYISENIYGSSLVHVGNREPERIEDKKLIRANIGMLGFETPTNILNNLSDENFRFLSPQEKIIRAAHVFFDVLSISDAREITPGQVKRLIRLCLEKVAGMALFDSDAIENEERDNQILGSVQAPLRRTRTFAAAVAGLVSQVTGRFNRTPMKFATEYIWVDGSMPFVKAWRDDRLLTREMSVLSEVLLQQTDDTTVSPWSAAALNCDERVRKIIKNLVDHLRTSAMANSKYELLKDLVVKNPCCSDELFNSARMPNEFKPFWISAEGESKYWVKYSQDSSDVQVDDITNTPPKKNTFVEVSIDNTRLPEMVEVVPAFKEYLTEKGIPYQWPENPVRMLTPYALTLYTGTIGEYFATYVLSLYGMETERFGSAGEEELFELFDFRFKGTDILLDVKNWAPSLRLNMNKESIYKEIAFKASKCGASKVVFIDCFGSSSPLPEVNDYTDADGRSIKVLEIDGLVSGKKISKKMLNAIKEFING